MLFRSHDEGRQIAAILGQATHIVDQPVISHLMSLSRPPKIVHIAAHTLHETDSPLFTSIKLGGEVLTVQQAFDLPLRGTQLVTLSGCATSSGLDSGGGLLAFQTAFFVAGAHRSLTSLWPVADEAASAWMREFYLHISQGYSVPAAIKGAQLAMLQDRSLQHPAIWAAFATWRC